jgi:hypothetical protein
MNQASDKRAIDRIIELVMAVTGFGVDVIVGIIGTIVWVFLIVAVIKSYI